jgi:tryptophan synthase alpha chain
MNRIDSFFNSTHKPALIAYLTVGYPDIETTLRAVPVLEERGCDIVELGIPFSDPLADGATIQRSSYAALQNGITPQNCLNVAAELRKKVNIPLIFMTYFNPIFKFGPSKFCDNCVNAGVDGLIIPDLPPDEGQDFYEAALSKNLDIVYLVAPSSSEKRIKLIAEKSGGFIYLVSVSGVTGARDSLPADIDNFVKRVRKFTNKPLCLGFGISTPEQAARMSGIADGVIIGSKLIELIEADGSLTKLSEFITDVRKNIDSSN